MAQQLPLPNGQRPTNGVVPSFTEIMQAFEKRGIDVGQSFIGQMQTNQQTLDNNFKLIRKLVTAFIVVSSIFMASILGGTFVFFTVSTTMKANYVSETERIIRAQSDITLANGWERLPASQRKERLREQYYKIVRYYTETVPQEQKMSDDQILTSFNYLWLTTDRIPSINFFFPLAYMKVATNFNPVYNIDYKKGISAMYLKTGDAVSNLPLVRNDSVFKTVYKGTVSLNDPNEAIKLLVARIDDLMITFQNREDWVLLALFTDEYNVLTNYWENGEGTIPDKIYKAGQLADALKYYYSFKNWQVPTAETK